ncbi:hypothetical protein COHA_008310 [Chlorella ohadii]|uniref:coproporphyrinogen oxidase n=1 Tax=Chlorella ohadii TaxID=2649997 RepID=A0AAD5DHK6_9CHLO|nr:hypothetical protein COHA_008310 [Chlorella ohadii]
MSARIQAVKLEAPNYVGKEEVPESLLRPGIDDPNSMRGKFERMIRGIQDQVCAAIEEVDGCNFRQDAWTRPSGGGGITRVLQEGNVWEKAGVAVSVVYGSMPAESYRVAVGRDIPFEQDDRVPFFAAGISSVMHPWNPHCPTMHFNYRYFETEDWKGIPGQWWFGGGTDITPSYVNEEDMRHFHGTYKAVCDRHDPAWYNKMKLACDDYFLIPHRGETRGMGGIFFDDLNDRDKDKIFAFSTDCAQNIVESYVPIIKKHKTDPYSERQKQWQQIRRGRYVEFNLVYDRGTIFGLKTGGRIESILMSLPLTASWRYDHQVDPQGPEQKFLNCVRNARAQSWVSRAQGRRSLVVTAAKKPAQGGKRRLDATGYIVDNSERGNIFAVEPKQLYTSSPTSDRAARQGLGGVQGLAVLAAAGAIVAAVTLGIAKNPADTLQGLAASGAADSLTAIADRISSSL